MWTLHGLETPRMSHASPYVHMMHVKVDIKCDADLWCGCYRNDPVISRTFSEAM